MNTATIKADVEKNIEKLAGLRDEVKVKLHLATLDAKKEWDDKIAPHVVSAEAAAKDLTEDARAKLQTAIQKVETFLGTIRD